MIHPATLQLDIRAHVPVGYRLTRQLLDQVVRRCAEEQDGHAVVGFDVRIVDWHGKGKHRVNQAEAWERFRGLLQQGRYSFDLRGN